jgi:hypothetical protein
LDLYALINKKRRQQMKKMTALLAGAMLMMATGSASALTIWFGDATNPANGYYVFDNNVSNPDNVYVPAGASILQDTSSIAGLIAYSGSFNGFNFTGTSGFSKPITGNADTSTLHLNTFEVTSSGTGSKTLEVWLTDTGYILPVNPLLNPNAVVTSSIGGASPGTVNWQGYIDPTNTGSNWGYYGGQLIGSGSFTGTPAAQGFSSNASLNTNLNGPFALTEGLSITQSAGMTTSVDWAINTTPVPEPGTMMLLGAGFLGLAIYGKRRKNA